MVSSTDLVRTDITPPLLDLETRAFPDRPHTPWAARWIHPPEALASNLWAFRLPLTLAEPMRTTVLVTADERYQLFLNGELAGRGPERGCPSHWYYETYQLDLPAGEHTLLALVSAFGSDAPTAQMSVRHGFLLSGTDKASHDLLATGSAPWEVGPVSGLSFEKRPHGWLFLGGEPTWDAASVPFGIEQGNNFDGSPPPVGHPGVSENHPYQFDDRPFLRPAQLPPMLSRRWTQGSVLLVTDEGPNPDRESPRPADPTRDLPGEHALWQDLLQGKGTITLPARTKRRILIDLDDYLCAFTHLTLSGGNGGTWAVRWAESLFASFEGKGLRGRPTKGNRSEWSGKLFSGEGISGTSHGSNQQRFPALWWDSGRYLEITLDAGSTDLTLESLVLEETRYPLEAESTFDLADERWNDLTPILVRGMQMCAHETYMDCPYYEQLMYVGDTRLEILTTYVLNSDDHLPRKAIELFDASRVPDGWTQSRFPSNSRQIIPGFSWWWIGMVHDYAFWRDDPAFVRDRLPGVRAVIEGTLQTINADGLIDAPPGWNFQDWVPDPLWWAGVPPHGHDQPNAGLHWQAILMLRYARELEEAFGDSELAIRLERRTQDLAAAAREAFWNADRGLFADNTSGPTFSVHPQCLALLSGILEADTEKTLLDHLRDDDLFQPTIYFSFYLLEVWQRFGRGNDLDADLASWFELPGRGFKTPPETPEPSRSDCHAWGSHPLFHAHASLCGIRPDSPGFHTVRITPLPCDRPRLACRTPHPRGWIEFSLERASAAARITLPDDVSGTLHWNGAEYSLTSGEQNINLS